MASRPSESSGTEVGAYSIEPGERVVVTGAAGFIGSSVLRELVDRRTEPVALVEPGGDAANLDGLDVERIEVDLRDADGVAAAVDGARTVFHVAALYRFWSPEPASFYDVNVGGTRNVMRAARDAEVGRVVYTSTVGTLGVRGATTGSPVDETSPAEIDHLFGLYKQSKYVAEHEALRAAAEGLPVVLVLPTTPVGPPRPRSHPDRPHGARVPQRAVPRLRRHHAQHRRRGGRGPRARPGRRARAVGRSYILGGENLDLREVLALLAEATGLPAPTRQFPGSLALAAAWVSDVVEGRLLGREPTIPLEAARMSTTHMSFDDSRARTELGYTSRPAGDALARAAHWFAESGYVRAERLARFDWKA